MVDSARQVAEGLTSAALERRRDAASGADGIRSAALAQPIPCIADGDTGYGNAVNAKRTVMGYARAGMAGVMIEDQVAPKRCGHVAGKATVGFDEAVQRVRAACNARDEYSSLYGPGTGPLILARTGTWDQELTTPAVAPAVCPVSWSMYWILTSFKRVRLRCLL
jgi:2-methylisocitrate lyase-like PEP mutase family enzyme